MLEEFTYNPPDAKVFLHTLRRYLEESGNADVAALLIGAICEFQTYGQFSHRRWTEFDATFLLRVPITSLGQFTEDVRGKLIGAADSIMPSEVGFNVCHLEVSPLMEAPPEEGSPLNQAYFMPEKTIEYDGLRFRSRTEIEIYNALKKRSLLFFPLAAAVFGGKGADYIREPDFVVCQDGKWGILEVMGDRYHTSSTAVKDHERARLFNDHRIYCIHFYDAVRCYNQPEEVVDDFLKRLARS